MSRNKNRILAILVVLAILSTQFTLTFAHEPDLDLYAETDEIVIEEVSEVSQFVLFDQDAANIYVHQDDHPQVLRVVTDFQADIELITGKKPQINNTAPDAGTAVIIGSIGGSPIIRQIIADGKLDEAKDIEGKWEAFVLKLVANPVPGVDKALVIAGSDSRGTIYGVYDMSERFGVSPWYWWGDVPVTRKSAVGVPSDFFYAEGEPSVKYRGIFMNDETNFEQWSGQLKNDTDSPGQVNAATYRKVYELILRLKMNALWPAMHEAGDDFLKYTDKGPYAEGGVSLNFKAANDYGIVIGTSHCEMLGRSAVDEVWDEWARRNYGKYDAPGLPGYDYSMNPQAILQFWREHLEVHKDFEAIYSVGMRGRHDGEMSFAGLPVPSGQSIPPIQDRVALLNRIIHDQRELLEEVLGKPAEEIPQALIPYNEIGEYYNRGLDLPEDVILMWAEDNYGQVRQISTDTERARSGRSGVYYHESYYGTPLTYLWLSTTSHVFMYEEMKRAYDTDADAYWIINVGDIKPTELSMNFWAAMSRDIDKYNVDNINEFYQYISMRDYGVDADTGSKIGEMMDKLYQITTTQRPEFMGGVQAFSRVNNGDEDQIVINRLNAIADESTKIYESLTGGYRDAYYQMVHYTVLATKWTAEWVGYQRMHSTSRTQGRYMSTIAYEQLSRYAWNNLVNDVYYYNKMLSDGKWDMIMDPYHTGGRIPMLRRPDQVTYQAPPTAVNALGSVIEGQSNGSENVTLRFSSLTNDARFLDVFTRDANPKDYLISTSAPFIKPGKTSGTVSVEERLWVQIDWDQLTPGVHEGTIVVYDVTNPDEPVSIKTFPVIAEKFNLADPIFERKDPLYVMANNYVVIEGEHFSRMVARGEDEWRVVPKLGRGSGAAVSLYPPHTSKEARITEDFQNKAARLEYDVYFATAGTHLVTVYRTARLNEGNYDDHEVYDQRSPKSMNAAVSLDDAEPTSSQIVVGEYSMWTYNATNHQFTRKTNWQNMVRLNGEVITVRVEVPEPGIHTLNVFQYDPSFAFDRILIQPGTTNTMGVFTHSVFGPPESYNTVHDNYPAERGILPDLSNLPELDWVSRSSFTFGGTTAWYNNVPADRIYGGKNSFGWNAPTTQQTATTGGSFHARDRQYQWGTEPRTFTATLPKPGKYAVSFTIGSTGTAPVRDVSNMSITTSDKMIIPASLTGINVVSGGNMEYFCIVETADNKLDFTFAGDPWAITVIDIIPYGEPQVAGDDTGYFRIKERGYIDAEIALEQSAFAWTTEGSMGTRWTETNGVSGTGMYHGPKSGTTYGTGNTANMNNSATMNYKVIFDEPGTYHVWFLYKAVDTNSQGVYIGLDGEFVQLRTLTTTDSNTSNKLGLYHHYSGQNAALINITDVDKAYTLTIGGQQTGMAIDRIAFVRESRVGFHYADWPSRHGAPMIRADVTAPEPLAPPALDTTTTFFKESFNTYDIGDFSTTSFWQAETNTSYGILDIVEDPDDADNKLLRLARPLNTGVVSLHNRNPLGLTGKFTIETRVLRTGSPTGSNNAWYIFGYDQDGFNPAAPASNPSAAIVLSPGNALNTYAVRGSNDLTRVGTTAGRTWTLVKILVDMDAGTFDYYVDGELVLEGGDLRTWVSGDKLDFINLFTNVNTTDVLTVDYINVYAEAEKAVVSAVKTLVEGYAANVVASVESALSGLKVSLFGKTADVVGGKAMFKFAAADVPAAGSFSIVVLDGDEVVGTTAISVVPLPGNLWSPTAIAGETTDIVFSAPIGFSASVKAVTIDGVPVSNDLASIKGNVLTIEKASVAGQAIVVKGLMFAELFPSYSFTFTVTAA